MTLNAISEHNAAEESLSESFNEFGVQRQTIPFLPKLQEVWADHAAVIPLLAHSQFKYSESGVMTIDYPALDIVFSRSGIDVSAETFTDYRAVLAAFVAENNKRLTNYRNNIKHKMRKK